MAASGTEVHPASIESSTITARKGALSGLLLAVDKPHLLFTGPTSYHHSIKR